MQNLLNKKKEKLKKKMTSVSTRRPTRD